MRKYLDIPATVIISLFLLIIMLWPLGSPTETPFWLDKVVHFIAFTLLAFPLSRTGRFGLLPVFIGASIFGGIILR